MILIDGDLLLIYKIIILNLNFIIKLLIISFYFGVKKYI